MRIRFAFCSHARCASSSTRLVAECWCALQLNACDLGLQVGLSRPTAAAQSHSRQSCQLAVLCGRRLHAEPHTLSLSLSLSSLSPLSLIKPQRRYTECLVASIWLQCCTHKNKECCSQTSTAPPYSPGFCHAYATLMPCLYT